MPLSTEFWPKDHSRAVVFNTEAAWFYLTSEAYRASVEGTTDVYCDGVGLAVYVRLRFGRKIRRLHGPDLMHRYLETAIGRRVMLFGGSELAHAGLAERYPRFFESNRVSRDTRMIAPDDFPDVAAGMARQGYDDVLIFLGLGRQEQFQSALHAAGFRGSSVGLGAAIDFLSGNKPRAGRVWQAIGLEWLPRLMREPRLWPRVGRSAALFLHLADADNRKLKSYLFGKISSRER